MEAFPISTASTARSRLPRLLQLMLALRADRFPNADELAACCEVSRRTVYRDLDVLVQAGVPVRYHPDRQGYQLGPGFGLVPAGVDEREALALLVLAHGWEGNGFGLGRSARNGARKLLNTLSEEARGRVLALSELIAVRDERPAPPPRRREVYETILRALSLRLQLRIWSPECDGAATGSTKVSPYRLIHARRIWLLVGRSTWHRQVRTFRVPWIRQAALSDDPYDVPPRFDLDRYLGRAWPARRGSSRSAAWLRFASGIAPAIADMTWREGQTLEARPDGSVELHLTIDDPDEFAGWVLGFGDQVEVLAPLPLREEVRGLAERVARLHRNPPAEDADDAGLGG